MKICVEFWVIMVYSLVVGEQRFGGTYLLYLQDRTRTLSSYQNTRQHNPEYLTHNYLNEICRLCTAYILSSKAIIQSLH